MSTKTKKEETRGPGRPTEVEGRVVKKYVTLDPATIKTLEKLGRGNLSAGIREAARQLRGKKKGGV